MFNNKPLSPPMLSRLAYVLQDDIMKEGVAEPRCLVGKGEPGPMTHADVVDRLSPLIWFLVAAELTVRETLTFAADLRLPHTTKMERDLRVRRVIRLLGLGGCADRRIGGLLMGGCLVYARACVVQEGRQGQRKWAPVEPLSNSCAVIATAIRRLLAARD